MIEILRRVVLVVGVYGAMVALVHARPAVVEVALEDFAASQVRRPAWSSDRDKPLADFIAHRTEGRRSEVAGPDWDALHAALVQVREGGSPGQPYASRVGSGREPELYLLPDEAPLADLGSPLHEDRPLHYARLVRPDGVAWLGLTWRLGREAHDAPAAFVRPFRSWWWVFLGGGLLLYVGLPRRRKGATTLAYSTVRAGILPDVVGLLLGGTFFFFALVLVPEISGAGALFVPAAWPAYLLFAVFIGLAWVIHGWAAWYEAFRLDVGTEALDLRTLGGARRIAFADVERAQWELRRAPKLLRRLLWGAALFDVRAAGQALILSARSDAELVLTETGGRRTRLRLTALEGAERVGEALADAGIPVREPAPPEV